MANKYILIYTAILVVLCGLFAVLAPTGAFGLTDFQIGQVAGRATVYILVAGLVGWVVATLRTKRK